MRSIARERSKAKVSGKSRRIWTSGHDVHGRSFSNNLLEQMVDRVMGYMTKEVRRLKSMIQQKLDVPSIPSVSNQTDETERMVCPESVSLINRHPRLVTFSGSENPQRWNIPLYSGFTTSRYLNLHTQKTS